jgi:hypothetical protein
MWFLVLFIVCGALLLFMVLLALYVASLELYPAWPAVLEKAALKAVLRLIDALGVLLAWGFWATVVAVLVYLVLARLGIVECHPVMC